MDEQGYKQRIALARKQGFSAGRRAGLWLAFNGPRAQAKARREDVRAMRRQDMALEGLGDVFGRAEENAQQRPKKRMTKTEAMALLARLKEKKAAEAASSSGAI